MERLADYVVLLELDESQLRHGSSVGSIKQKFPESDWEDVPFSPSLNVFCMPQGWNISREPQQPTYFVGTLTDLMGSHQYACCLQFWEPMSSENLEALDDAPVTNSTAYKPKVLVLLTRFTFFEFFRMCLNMIRFALAEDGSVAENIVATILAALPRSKVPYPISVGQERFILRATTQSRVPMTGTAVADLVRFLGSLHNLLLLYRCVLQDQKIVLHSRSMNRLSIASYAIKAILFPMEYTYPFVPLLPEQMLEYLESPTPFLMGILSEHSHKVNHIDAVFVNLDTGEISIPSSAELPDIPSPFVDRLLGRLQSVLSPELEKADHAEAVALPPVAKPFVLDKHIRACFLLFIAEVLYGYRSCLQVVRLRGPPLIVFHKAAFEGLRHLNSPFLSHVLQGQMFQLFVTNRGIPFRECDIFDELVVRNPQLGLPPMQNEPLTESVLELAAILEKNEQQEHFMSMTPAPREIGSLRNFDTSKVEELLKMETERQDPRTIVLKNKLVPASAIEVVEETNNARRIMVLTACIDAIFDNRLPEARRMLNAVELALRIVEARVFLCRQLSASAVPVTRATLTPQQFELVVRLLNCALGHETEEDEHGIAYACLHLCNLYCRRLTQGVHQYAYTCVQDHSVWANARFWEAAFFHDVHELMRHTYGAVPAADFPLKGNSRFGMWNLSETPTGMQVAADILQSEHELTEEKRQLYKEEEDAIVYGQAKHYINLMVCLKIPLDPSRLRRVDKADLELRGNTIGKKDLVERTDSESDNESGYAENCNDGDIGATVVTWITSLIDRLCCAARLDSSKVDRLITDISGFVAVHIDNLEQVYAESRKIAPPPRTKLLTPVMLTPSEKVISGPLRCCLLVNEKLHSDHPENIRYPLPAEGAVYLTNYRVVFKGQPINPYLSDDIIVRSIPVMSLVKEKSISDGHLEASGYLELIPSKIVNGLHDAIQIRSSCYILMNLAFDIEVSAVEAEEFLKTMTAQRWPAMLPQTLFAYAPVAHLMTTTLPPNQKNKISTIRDLKKTISKQLPIKGSLMKRSELKMSPQMKALTQPRHNVTITNEADYLDLGSSSSTVLSEARHYLQDYERLRLKADNSLFRLSYANTYYDVVKTYPACFIVPCASSDATFAKVSKGFKNGRLPVITWISENGALLIRGAGCVSTGNMLDKIKKANILHTTESSSTSMGSQLTVNSRDTMDSSTHSSSDLQEAYISRLAQASPSGGSNSLATWHSQASSLISIDSLLTGDAPSQYGNTPDLNRKSTTSDLMRPTSTFMRASTGKSGNKTKTPSTLQSRLHPADKQISQKSLQSVLTNINRKNLYVLVDKGQHKGLKVDKYTSVVPITYPSTGEMKVAFKKLLRAAQPGELGDSHTFYRHLDDSGWRHIACEILGLAASTSSVISIFNSSVALCIEEGYDITCILMSLVQIMQDSYYRTFEGFRTLVEKEWMAFGYRFSHRANHTLSSQSRGIAPVFLIFLDCVHQIVEQYAAAFEFDDYYLRFIAFHSQSGFFRNFIFDSELERVKMDKYAPESFNGYSDCIWAYIKHQTDESTIFSNLQYVKTTTPLVMTTSVASFDVWSFYTEDDFVHGSCYDIEIAQAELAELEERRLANAEGLTGSEAPAESFDGKKLCGHLRFPDGITQMLQEVDKANPMEKKTGSWQKNWESVAKEEHQALDIEHEALDETGVKTWEQHVDHQIQKRNGLKLILKGEYARASKSQAIPKAHSFEHYSATGSQPHDCNLCHFALYGQVVKTGQRCRNCGVVAHEKCVLNITWPCGLSIEAREKAIEEARTVREQSAEKTLRAQVGSNDLDISMETRTLTVGRGRPIALHQGYLKKRGTKFKMWTPRWFILEAQTHRLTYFENETDAMCRGAIDLTELTNVEVLLTGNKAILELKTASRTFSLLAEGKADALAWKDKIEQVLRE